MSSLLLQTYHRLPGWTKSLAATLHGAYLRGWRYGPETDPQVAEALTRDRWSEQQWRQWREERLALVLHRAATQVPFYREHWSRRRQRGDRASWEVLENWPVLEKEAVRANPLAFLVEGADTRNMFAEHTSGTSGTPLTLWCSRETLRTWYALYEARCRRWYGVSRHDPWAMLGGQLVVSQRQTHPPFWVWNAAMNQLYMSAYHLAPQFLTHYVEALKRHRVRYLLGYSSALCSLAQGLLREGRGSFTPSVVITNAEPLIDYQRDLIEEAFGCPVREGYGMSEIVAAASECESGGLHLWPDAGVVECLEHDAPAAPGQPGDLVCTGLVNADMPLIRYRVGDRAVLEESSVRCPCGRHLPLVRSIEGRIDDQLLTADGRRVGRLGHVFKGGVPIVEAQVVQEALDLLRVLYVPAPGFNSDAEQAITRQLRERMGPVRVVFERVDTIPRSANGKFKTVVSKLAREGAV